MKINRTFLLTGFSLLTGYLFSQSVTSLNGQIGTTYVLQEVFVNPADTGSLGANQTWDFSLMDQSPDTIAFTFRLPTTAELSTYPTINTVIEDDLGNLNFCIANADSLSQVAQLDQFGDVLTLVDPLVAWRHPLTSTTSYSDYATGPYAGFDLFITSNTVCQGSGTLITHQGIFTNVLKMKKITNIDFASGGVPIATLITTDYTWVNNYNGYQIFSITTADNNSYTAYELRDPQTSLGIEDNTLRQIIIAPNPVSEQLQLKGDKIASPIFYEIRDLKGEIVLSGSTFINETISVDSIKQGAYLIYLNTKSAKTVQPFVKL